MGDVLTLKQLFQIPQDVQQRLADKTFVGIDFGTSTTVVSVASYNSLSQQVECESLDLEQMLPDGTITENQLLPTVMAFNGKQLLVGEGAYQLKGNPDYIFGASIWHSFKMELGKDMGPKWTSVTQLSQIKSPQEATTIFFRFIKREVEKVVKKRGWSSNIYYTVSIPASFESNQRLDLLRALDNNCIELDGSNLIDEPNAAFIGYINPDYTHKEPIKLQEGYNPKVLVFDFGAGTCDISILELSADYNGYHSRNISISQFTELGGNDIDRYIAYNFLLPQILRENGKTEDDFNSQQIEIIANQLLGIAEHLKKLCCKDFQYLLSDQEALNTALDCGQGKKYLCDLKIYTEYGDLKKNSFLLTYKEFMEAMHAFLNNKHLPIARTIKRQKRYNSIYATIASAIKKANINKGEIDYVMMIGGSSKNPYVQQCVKEYFPKGTTVLIPQDLQALVSQGAALHSLLRNGLDTTIVRPITSEPIITVIRGNQEIPLIPAGTEIPFEKVTIPNFTTGDYEQSVIEIPICVSKATKMVANVKIEDPIGTPFPKNTPISLSLEMNADKVLKIKAHYLDQECEVKSENPFANTYLTDEEKRILEAERNTYLSADKNNGRPSKQSLESLRKAYIDADKEFQAAETYEQQIHYYPQNDVFNYIGVLFHNSGNYTKAIRYFEKALEINPENIYALSNLGHDLYLVGKNQDAKNFLEKALEISADHTTALSKMGDIYRDAGNTEKANEYYERCFNIFMRQWNNHTLQDVDYGWFETIAYRLGKADFAREINEARPKKQKSVSFNSQNLISIDKDHKDEDL